MPRTYRKEIKLVLETEAQNREEATMYLNEVAYSIHSLGHPLTTGGKENRVVTQSHKSTGPYHVTKAMLKKGR
jgi:hypothetical protein